MTFSIIHVKYSTSLNIINFHFFMNSISVNRKFDFFSRNVIVPNMLFCCTYFCFLYTLFFYYKAHFVLHIVHEQALVVQGKYFPRLYAPDINF